jgi:hypothetical protein
MTEAKPKKFNIAGPCNPPEHYMLPALARLPDVQGLIDGKEYFVLHAYRSQGKAYIGALADKINNDGRFCALYCSLPTAQDAINPDIGMAAIQKKLKTDINGSEARAIR